ncbi:MAG: ADOP family duplicated permease [Gemmatimonadales bacterium]
MPRILGLRRIVRPREGRSGADLDEIDAELRFHLDCRVDELTAGGMSQTDARAVALREFGEVARYRHDVVAIDHRFSRETHMRELAESIWSDVQHAARGLRSQPGFAAVAVITLALGIAATTSVFSAVDGVLLRPLPYPEANRIMHVGERDLDRPSPGGTTSYDNFNDWRASTHSFSALGIVSTWAPTLTGHGDPVRARVARVSSELFDVFHVTPALGRRIEPRDNAVGAADVALLSYDLWRTRFGGDRNIVGQTIELNFTPARVVGVLPEGLRGPGRLDRPIWMNFVNDTSDGRSGRSKDVYGLLRPNATVRQAQGELTALSRQLALTYPKDDKGLTAVVDPLINIVVGDVERPLYMLVGASLLVLLIACANLSNLLLTRGLGRRREIAVRAALGASRARIARQLVTESAVLALAGCVAGVLIARVAVNVLRALGPAVFASRPPTIDGAVLAATVLVSAFTTLLVGLVPAFRLAPRNPQLALRDAGARVAGNTGTRTRTALAVTQLALAMVLLSTSLLVIKSFVRLLGVDPGIRTDHMLTMEITLPAARYDGKRSTLFYQQLADRLRAMPAVRDVAFTSLVPLSGNYDTFGITKIAGAPDRSGSDAAEADRFVVSPSYFHTEGVRLLRGRLLNDDDRFDSPLVCVVDEAFARRIFGTTNPIGRRMQLFQRAGERLGEFHPASDGYATIVGVVTHVQSLALDSYSPGQVYTSDVQYPWRWSAVLVHTVGDPLAFAPTVTRAVHELDPQQPVDDVASLDDYLRDSVRAHRFTLALLGAFAAAAILLAAIGLYGVVAYGASQRRREFGIRMALGAQRRDIARRVLSESARIALAGAVIGVAGALVAGQLVASLLFEVSPRDAGVLASVCAALLGVAIAASVVPARRATSVDAAEVMRAD